MELYKEAYKHYMTLQSDFNTNVNYEEQQKIFKELSGKDQGMTVIAKFERNYEKSENLTRIGIVPKYILNGDDAIPFKLYNRIRSNDYPGKRIFASAKRNIDDKKWSLIKELGDKKLFKCDIYLHDPNSRNHFGKVFSFYPQSIDKIPVVDLKKYDDDENPLMTHCSVYQIFNNDEEKSKDSWNYDDFLLLLKEDICDDIVEKAKKESNPEIEKLSGDIARLTSDRDALRDIEIPAKKAEKTQLDTDISKKQKEKGVLEKRLGEIDKLIEEKNKSLKSFRLDDKINFLSQETSCNNTNEERTNKAKIDDDTVIESIQNAFKTCIEGVELIFSKTVIEQMCAGLHTNQLIVLAGDPGSGKTSLAANFGKCLPAGGKTKIIPVQPGWMEKSDLLGYYNPIEKCYVPTEFLDTLIDYCKFAKEQPDKYFFICLDEMNLSQIEYYFADFLSKLQTDRTITIYSRTIYEEMRSDYLRQAERFVKMHKGAIDDIKTYTTKEEFEEYLKLEHTKKSLERYTSEIIIPEKVKFIGTLNQDETTKDISPKVLDRSMIIKLQNNVQKFILGKETESEKNSAFGQENKPEDNIGTEVKSRHDCWKEMIEGLQEQGITVSKRLDNVEKELDLLFNDDDRFFDVVISTMILPKINCSQYQPNVKSIKDVLERYCTFNRVSSYYIFEDMKNRFEKEKQGLLTFWSK